MTTVAIVLEYFRHLHAIAYIGRITLRDAVEVFLIVVVACALCAKTGDRGQKQGRIYPFFYAENQLFQSNTKNVNLLY